MSYLDIAFLGLVLILALTGLKTGFIKSLFGTFGWLIALVIALFAAKPLANALAGGFCKDFVYGTEGWSFYLAFKQRLPENVLALPVGASEAQIKSALGNGIFGTFMKPFVRFFQSSTFAKSGLNPGEGLGLFMGNLVFTFIIGVILFVVARVLVSILGSMLISAVNSYKPLSAVNRILGFVFGAARGALYAAVLLLCASLFTGFTFMKGYNKEINKSTICKPLTEYAVKIPEKLLNQAWFNKILKDSGLKPAEPDDGGLTPDEGETEGGEQTPDSGETTARVTPVFRMQNDPFAGTLPTVLCV